MSVKNMGHAMIGIEYSRYSALSKRYERCSLKYGFYPAFNSIPTGTGESVAVHFRLSPLQRFSLFILPS